VRLGAYELGPEIGRGGCGVVYRGRSPDGRDVAVKMMLDPSGNAVKRFDRERRLLASLAEADGFVPLLDAGASPQGPYIVMPFVGGGSLRDRLRHGPMPVEAAIDLTKQLGRALGVAHERGIVHRDLKPENILFTAEGTPLVTDLGLAKHFRSGDPGVTASVALSKTGDMRGTVGYMAPEQLDRAKDAGPPADVFALGAILYECLAGRPAFDGDNVHTVLAKVSTGSYESLRSVRSDIPRWLGRVVVRTLRTDPAARFPDGRALLEALEIGPRARSPLVLVAVSAVVLSTAVVGAVMASSPAAHAPALAPAPVVTAPAPVAPAPPRPKATPAWYLALDKQSRPPLPLPRGLELGERPGEYVNAKDGSLLLYVPAGSFTMGNPARDAHEDQRPPHPVELSAYFIGKLEVTNRQFEQFVKETGFHTVAETEGGGLLRSVASGSERLLCKQATWRLPFGNERKVDAPPDHPVVQLAFSDAAGYCAWAGLRLPTEAEWERAAGWDARAHRSRPFPWGDDPPRPNGPRLANTSDRNLASVGLPEHVKEPELDDGWAATAPVGSYPEGASPIGALDMGGNAREWVQDVYDAEFYNRSPRRDPVCLEGSSEGQKNQGVLRGGSFLTEVGMMRSSTRDDTLRMYRGEDTGVRVARDGL
jgi:formylglycine-generating enzyme required for sulfatase activity